MGATWLAPVGAIGHHQRVAVDQGCLDTWPGTHIGADLLAHMPGQPVGRECHQPQKQIGGRISRTREKVGRERGRIVEVENPRPARRRGDEQPDRMLGGPFQDLGRAPRRLLQSDALVAVTLDQALDHDEKVCPYGLRAGIAAPHPAKQRGHKKQEKRGQDQESRYVIDFLRPDLDPEEIEALAGQVDQHSLVGNVRSPVPPHPGQQVIGAQHHGHAQPFQRPELAMHKLWKNGHTRNIILAHGSTVGCAGIDALHTVRRL